MAAKWGERGCDAIRKPPRRDRRFTDDGGCVGAGALARFPDCLERPPSDWFDEATMAQCGVPLELAVVRRALAALRYVPRGQYLSINVSPATILSGELEPLLAAAGDRDVVLEVTEHSPGPAGEPRDGIRQLRLRRQRRTNSCDESAPNAVRRHSPSPTSAGRRLGATRCGACRHEASREAGAWEALTGKST